MNKKNFKDIMEEIKQFIKKPKVWVRYSTNGKWTLTKFLTYRKR